MAVTTEKFELTFENGIEIKLRWKLNNESILTIIEMDENGNLGSIVDHFATVVNAFVSERVSAAVEAMKAE